MNKSILLLFLLLWVAGGCTQTEVEERPVPAHALKDVEAVFKLHVLANQVPVTRSDGEDGVAGDTIPTRSSSDLDPGRDNNIVSLWIGQYDATGALLYHYYSESMTSNTINVKLKQNQSSDNSKSHVWFVANSGDLGEISTETKLKQHVLTYSSTATGLPQSGLCGMSGMWEGIMKDEGGDKEISVDLTRLLAKITFTYTISEAPNSFSFDIDSIMLKSVPDRSQVAAPEGQLSEGVTYITYKEEQINNNTGSQTATLYWYLPENMAGDGTASSPDDPNPEKKKTGKGVTNATYIEMAGTAVQDGVTYKEVVFRFYPGKDHKNNYDIVRNSHYKMDVTLVGIDVTDERITVGEIPPIEIVGDNMPAEKGGTKEVQITARPGQEWLFEMPSWLSASLNNRYIDPGATFSYQGPAKVVFKAVEANPKVEKRDTTFTIKVGEKDQEITIIQDGATLIKGGDVSLEAAMDSEGSSSFTATEGLQWLATLNDGDDWLDWVSKVTNGSEVPAGEQALKVKATSSNPSAQERIGQIVVKAGASVGDPNYTKLKQEITVRQIGSTVSGSSKTVAAEAANGLTSTFTATSGLNWVASVADGSWITLLTTSGGPTTKSDESINYNVAVNPFSSMRSSEITVRAGNTNTGPTGKIKVTQNASSLTAGDPATLAATKDATGSLKITGTSDLPLKITPPSWIEITTIPVPIQTTGSPQIVEYKTKEVNLNSIERTGTNISVQAGDMIQTVAIAQSGSTFTVSETELSFEKAGGSKTVTVNGTSGLPWTVTPSVANSGITTDIESTNANGEDQTLTFTAAENAGGARETTFTIAVPGGNQSKTVKVKQKAGLTNTVTIDASTVAAYKSLGNQIAQYPPFNYDGGVSTGTLGSDKNGVSLSCTLTKAYTIEVENTERSVRYKYEKAISQCPSGWRIPTMIELYAMWEKCRGMNNDATDDEPASTALGDKFEVIYYWSSSVYNKNPKQRCKFYMASSELNYDMVNIMTWRVRCVRDL